MKPNNRNGFRRSSDGARDRREFLRARRGDVGDEPSRRDRRHESLADRDVIDVAATLLRRRRDGEMLAIAEPTYSNVS